MSEEPGSERVIAGRYRLLSPLGEGGMGTVWRARDEVLRREVAVKEVRAPAGLPEADVRRMYARLEREAWAAARVAHRNVVTVYDVATDDGRPWIVMELVRGLSLADVLDAEGPLEPRRAALIGAEVLAALRAAHAAGVLHRDVKPANVLLSDDGRVVLTDFGIARVEGSSALTMTGEVIGSPEFLAPERALGRTPGPESDLWSLGVLLYTAVEGASPFRQDTPLSTLRAVVDEELPPPHRAGALAPVVEGLLRKDPAGPEPGASTPAPSRTGSSGEPSPSASSKSGGPESGRTPQSVRVSVAGAHTEYEGSCPPPHGRAPAFTATFTVDRLPARVGYRWVTEDGSVSAPGWRTLSFPADGDRSRQDTVVVTTHEESGTFEGAVRVEVREPVGATSNAVAFSVTCVTRTETETETEPGTKTPTGGASSSSSPSPSAPSA
ncbi:serine/threonine-protein kinase [Streptomyces rochei]|uniref:serine/threonine-protein kinase n=1 Tax=Streptomyces rochei TaxID=1928 RepID=UPI00362C69AC